MDSLDPETRLKLCAFACAFAWADFTVQPEEREHLARLVKRLKLDEDERRKVEAWLKSPPPLDDLDPQGIPQAKRALFLKEAEDVIRADGVVQPEEEDSIKVLRRILKGE
jgi:tellurite resistance protein